MKPPDRATRRPGVHLSDLEHMVLLATSPRRLGRAGHVELLLLLGDVGQDRAQSLVLDDCGLVHLQPPVGVIPILNISSDDEASLKSSVEKRRPNHQEYCP